MQLTTNEYELHRNDIISLFLDKEASPLSIQNICRIGKVFNCVPGDYWRPLSALLALGLLTCEYVIDSDSREDIKESISWNENCNKRPFSMLLFKSGLIEFELIKKETIKCLQAGKSLLVTFIGMFGHQYLDKIHFRSLENIIAHHTCAGVVGGVNREAYNIIGSYKEFLLLLDPHLVNVSKGF